MTRWTSGLETPLISLLSSFSLFLSIYSIPPHPPLAQNYRRQLLWGHSLGCKLPSLSSHVPSPVLVLGRCVLATGDLPGVDIVSHQLRAVALTRSEEYIRRTPSSWEFPILTLLIPSCPSTSTKKIYCKVLSLTFNPFLPSFPYSPVPSLDKLK